MFVVADALVFRVEFSDDFLEIGHFFDLAGDVGFVGFEEFLLRCVVLEDEGDLFVLLFEGDDFLYHFFVDDCNGDRILSISQVILQIEGISIVLHKHIILLRDILNLILLRMLNH